MHRFSIFLTPAQEDFTYTSTLIEWLAARYGTMPFEPHVTIYAGECADFDALRDTVSRAVEGIQPFPLQVRRIGYSKEYFKTLYIEFKENECLRAIHDAVRAEIKPDSGYTLIPHLSLLYADMPLRDKETLARKVVIDRPEIHFKEVKIMRPGNLAEGWRDTVQWQTLYRVELGEAGLKKPVRAVIFDFGGVLAEEGFRDGLYAIANSHGLNPQAFHQLAMDAIYDSGYILGKGSEADFWKLLWRRAGLNVESEELSDVILQRFVLRSRLLDAVRKLRGQGILTAILSDQTDWLASLDRRYNFFQEFDMVFNSYNLGKGKRDPTMFDDVVSALKVKPNEALFIDDMLPNVERARLRGLQAILFTDEEQLLEELEWL